MMGEFGLYNRHQGTFALPWAEWVKEDGGFSQGLKIENGI